MLITIFHEEEEILLQQAKVKFPISWMCQFLNMRYVNCDYDEDVSELKYSGRFLQQVLPNYTASHRVNIPMDLAVTTQQFISKELKSTTLRGD